MKPTSIEELLPAKGVSPPRSQLILRIGITGHRLDKLEDRNTDHLKNEIKRVFEVLKDLVVKIHKKDREAYSTRLVFRLISPLADGTDQIAADAAIDNDFELECPFPFFKSDGVTDEQKEYEKKLNKGKFLELDGSHANEEQAYEAAGRMVLRHCDVLIAVWDGDKARGIGGTGQIVEEAHNLGIPVIRIDPDQKNKTSILIKTKKGEWNLIESETALIRPLVRKLRPPLARKILHSKDVDFRNDYFKEKVPSFSFTKKRNLNWSVELNDVSALNDNERLSLIEVVNSIETKIRRHYEYADRLAKRYTNLYRTGFIWNYLVSGFAVLFAFLGFASHNHVYAFLEFFAIASIIFVYLANKKWKWNDRRIDYRLLAELLRQTRFLATISRTPPLSPPEPIHLHYGDPSSSWVQWHFLAIVRELGITPAKFSPQYLKAVAKLIQRETNEQASYHETKFEKSERAEKTLHKLAFVMFICAAIGCGLHIIKEIPAIQTNVLIRPYLNDFKPHLTQVLSLLSIVAPAFGAAFAGIRSQGEYERVARHSAAMGEYLHEKSEELDTIQNDPALLNSASLAKIADEISQKMIEEVLDWRIVFHKRPIELA